MLIYKFLETVLLFLGIFLAAGILYARNPLVSAFLLSGETLIVGVLFYANGFEFVALALLLLFIASQLIILKIAHMIDNPILVAKRQFQIYRAIIVIVLLTSFLAFYKKLNPIHIKAIIEPNKNFVIYSETYSIVFILLPFFCFICVVSAIIILKNKNIKNKGV